MAKTLFLIVTLAGLHFFALGIPEGRVIGGKEAEPGQFPYMASLQVKDKDNSSITAYTHICGAVILTNKTVLTAAACYFDYFLYQVYVGSNKLDGDGIIYEIESFLIHPNYSINPGDGTLSSHDIAVIILKEEMTFSPMIQPAILDTEYVTSQENVTSAGWGQTEDIVANIPNELHYMNLLTKEHERCRFRITEGFFPAHYSQFCMLNIVGEGICGGDTGGPVTRNGKLVGVVSYFGHYCAIGFDMGATRISTEIDWIRSVAK